MTPITLPQAIAESKRELALRLNVYPKWTQAGKLSTTVAEHRIACSKFIVERLEMLLHLQEAGAEMNEAGDQMRLTLPPRENPNESESPTRDSLPKPGI